MSLKKIQKDMRFAWSILQKRPFNVLIQVTNRCNMRCSFCDFWPNGVAPKKELTLEDFRNLAQDLSKIGCFLISIEGGEPMVRPDLIDIVEIFGKDHLPILYTNGWYITRENAQELFAKGLHQVGVSIDYSDAKRHDAKRDIEGAFEKAWQAAEYFRDAAPYKGRQVHIMTIIMKENWDDLENLFKLSASYKIRHSLTLLSISGYRRGKSIDEHPLGNISEKLLSLWKKYPHLFLFRDYLKNMDAFLHNKDSMPTCHAGEQSINIDHLGNVATCIEKIDKPLGNIRLESIVEILPRLKHIEEVASCQECWTLCRGFSQALGNRGSLSSWIDMSTRMRL